ncbi:Conserved_hypothetical protein [Hexamita inflata]|uniref:DUF1349 domain-containing protein n=1 Tax=Hexamita inflata TaxID=28002 RepID=A0AA86RBJ1_9EUKA|nr:Conserved hypothetical protein [Hexamita inflata]
MQNYSFINEPKKFTVTNDSVTITTEPKTDYFNKTHYNFEVTNGPAYVTTATKNFTYTVRAQFKYQAQYDQAQIFMFIDENNWVKAGLEGSIDFKQIGAVVTQSGYSDWSSFDFDPKCEQVILRLHRKGDDFKIEFKTDNMDWTQLRIFHMTNVQETVKIGVMACSPSQSSFDAKFDQFKLEELLWK